MPEPAEEEIGAPPVATKTKEAKPTDEDRIDLAEQVGVAQRELAELQDEQERLPGLLTEAAREGDAAAVIRYRHRSDELPTLLFAAEVRMLRSQIAQAEIERELLGPTYEQAAEEAERLKAVLDEAQRAYREAAGRASMLYAEQSDWGYRAGQSKLRLDRVIADSTPRPGPVVRSTWQGGAA